MREYCSRISFPPILKSKDSLNPRSSLPYLISSAWILYTVDYNVFCLFLRKLKSGPSDGCKMEIQDTFIKLFFDFLSRFVCVWLKSLQNISNIGIIKRRVWCRFQMRWKSSKSSHKEFCVFSPPLSKCCEKIIFGVIAILPTLKSNAHKTVQKFFFAYWFRTSKVLKSFHLSMQLFL